MREMNMDQGRYTTGNRSPILATGNIDLVIKKQTGNQDALIVIAGGINNPEVSNIKGAHKISKATLVNFKNNGKLTVQYVRGTTAILDLDEIIVRLKTLPKHLRHKTQVQIEKDLNEALISLRSRTKDEKEKKSIIVKSSYTTDQKRKYGPSRVIKS